MSPHHVIVTRCNPAGIRCAPGSRGLPPAGRVAVSRQPGAWCPTERAGAPVARLGQLDVGIRVGLDPGGRTCGRELPSVGRRAGRCKNADPDLVARDSAQNQG